MKEKLEKVKEALVEFEKMEVMLRSYGDEYHKCEMASNAIAIIDSMLAELDSPELVERVAEVINNSHPLRAERWNTVVNLSECDGYMVAKGVVKNTRIQAKAAIEAITNNN